MAFKMKGFSPFTQSPIGPSHSLRMMRHRQNIDLRRRDEENKDELLEKYQEKYIKKAERKEKKADKREEQGRERSAARKRRKATKLRDQASNLTADEVVSRRAMMRTPSPFPKKDKPINKLLKGDFKGVYSDYKDWRKRNPKNPNLIEATMPDIPIGPGGSVKLLKTFSKVAKKRKQMSKAIQKMLEKKGYKFK